MSNLSKFTKVQLDKRLLETKAELERREIVTKATKEIQSILNKYSITIGDIDVAAFRLNSTGSQKGKVNTKKKTKGSGSKDNRASVAPKYKNIDSDETWSGRGRSPKWVISKCKSEGISIESFKRDERFIIT
jgi:DNA-binding protein H-NS